MQKILISIVNWNSPQATKNCLSGIAKLPRAEQPDIVVADNFSPTSPLELTKEFKAEFRSLKIVNNPENLGFAGGHNPNIKAAKEAGYDYVVILNPDTEFIDQNIFTELISALEASDRALAAAPTILSNLKPATVWYGGGKLSTKTSVVKHLRVGDRPSSQSQAPQKVSFITGCCFAIALKRANLSQLLFNEDYFLYWEDADWCARAQEAGFELLYVPDAQILHHVSSSLGVRSPTYIYYNIRNHFMFIKQHVHSFYKCLAFLRVLFISFKYIANIGLRYSKKQEALMGLWHGWMAGLGGKSGKLGRTP